MTGWRLLAVHAHPDDETITTGGLLAHCADRGIETMVICCACGSADANPNGGAPGGDRRVREAELRAACAILGVTHVRLLGYADSGMAGSPANDAPGSFWRADVDEATRRLVEHLRAFRPHVAVSYDPNGGYGHPDHIQAHRITLLAVAAAHHRAVYPEAGRPWRVGKLYYTALPRSEARRYAAALAAVGAPPPFSGGDPDTLAHLTPDDQVTASIDCGAQAARKRLALQAHASQLGPDFRLLALPLEVLRAQFPREYFQLACGPWPARRPETDLFAGLADAPGPPQPAAGSDISRSAGDPIRFLNAGHAADATPEPGADLREHRRR